MQEGLGKKEWKKIFVCLEVVRTTMKLWVMLDISLAKIWTRYIINTSMMHYHWVKLVSLQHYKSNISLEYCQKTYGIEINTDWSMIKKKKEVGWYGQNYSHLRNVGWRKTSGTQRKQCLLCLGNNWTGSGSVLWSRTQSDPNCGFQVSYIYLAWKSK